MNELPALTLDLLGASLLEEGDGDGAESLLRQAQRRHPRDPWLKYHLGVTLEQLGRTDEAIRYLMAARDIKPELAHNLAHFLEYRGETDEAIAVFQDLCRLRPEKAWHLTCLGGALRERGLNKEADAACESAVAILEREISKDPDDAYLHQLLGHALHHSGQLGRAVSEFRTAIRLKADSPCHTLLGNALAAQDKLDEASAEFRISIRLEPDSAIPHLNLGDLLCNKRKDYPAAEGEYRIAIRLRPNYASAHASLGAALEKQGKLDEAIAEYRTRIRLTPDDAKARYNLGALLCDKARDYPAAESEFRAAIRLKPDFAPAHSALGRALAKQGRLDDALAEYRTATQLKPDEADAHCSLGAFLCDGLKDLPGGGERIPRGDPAQA